MKTALQLALLAALASPSALVAVHAQNTTSSPASGSAATAASTARTSSTAGAPAPVPPPPPPADHAPAAPGAVDHWAPWYWTGAQSVIWHTRYHGCLAMAAYGDYRTTCPQFFTRETLQRQYPGNPNVPFEVIGEWGPTPKYGSEGFMVKVHEMNKILMVFKGIFGWENFNATLAPLLGVGCDERCMAHAGAIEAWQEVKEATNDMQAIRENQGDLVWSASGHGFGGMIMQVGALELKHRGLLFSAQSFGSPPVFNVNAARRWDDLFISDASQRTVSNRDAVPAKIPYRNKYMPDGTLSNSSYAFVNTGIHVWTNSTINEAPMGSASMYGQNYVYCLFNNEDPRCAGGDSEEDHYFYFTDLGYCCESHEDGWTATYNATFNRQALRSDQAAYSATATAPKLDVPNTSLVLSTPTTTIESSTVAPSTVPSANVSAVPSAPGAANAGEQQNNVAAGDTGSASIGKESSGAMIFTAMGAVAIGMLALF